MKNEGFRPQEYGKKTPKNEGNAGSHGYQGLAAWFEGTPGRAARPCFYLRTLAGEIGDIEKRYRGGAKGPIFSKGVDVWSADYVVWQFFGDMYTNISLHISE